MNAAFLDTVGLLALWDTSDQWHQAAEQAFSKLREATFEVDPKNWTTGEAR